MAAVDAVDGAEWVFDLSEVMGGIGFIESNRIACAESVEIGVNLLRAASRCGVERFFFSSSACVYPTHLQAMADGYRLREVEAWPARPEAGYGFQKLYMEELCRSYREERGLETRVARYHNVYGPFSSWNDGKEKSPAAICRKVAEAKLKGTGTVEVWGDGSQRRSYLFVDDCVDATVALMASDHSEPVNVGSERDVSVDELVSLVEAIAGVTLARTYDTRAPQGVRGRSADLTVVRAVLGWEPSRSLEKGLAALYGWVESQVAARL